MRQQSLKLLHPTVKEKMHLQENALFKMVPSVTYAPTKFESAVSKTLGGDAFTRKYVL